MTTQEKIKNMLCWGLIVWLFGYITGVVLFFVVPEQYIGWIITPLATIFTIWVLIHKVRRPELLWYIGTGLIWTLMAIVLDYVFNVVLFQIGNSYYKPDVFLYYFLTFTLPIAVGFWKSKHKSPKSELF